MSTAAQITRSAEISYEQFCHAWIAEVKAHLAGEAAPDAGNASELRRQVITRLLRDALQFDFGDDEIVWTDAAACGFDAFLWDEDDDGAPITRLVRFLKIADLPAGGRAVTRAASEQGNYPQLWGLWNLTERVMRTNEAFMSRLEKLLRA